MKRFWILDFGFWILDWVHPAQAQAQAQAGPKRSAGPGRAAAVVPRFSNLKSQISNLKSQISNLKSQFSGLQIQNPKSNIQNLLLCALCASAVILPACTTEHITTSDARPMPPAPRPAPPTPASAKADRMAFFVGSKPDDTNNNGYPDSIKATVVLFASQYPTAIRQDGAFVFTLYQQGQFGVTDAKPVGTWRVEGEALKATFSSAQYGPCYQFQLSLLDVGGDMLPLDRADMVCRFEPADGSAPVQSAGVRSIQIGRRLTSGLPGR